MNAEPTRRGGIKGPQFGNSRLWERWESLPPNLRVAVAPGILAAALGIGTSLADAFDEPNPPSAGHCSHHPFTEGC
ncbi:hypothetical protein [Streptomyces sp. NPDC001970]